MADWPLLLLGPWQGMLGCGWRGGDGHFISWRMSDKVKEEETRTPPPTLCTCMWICMYVGGCTCYGMCFEVRRQHLIVCSLLLSCTSRTLNSGCQSLTVAAFTLEEGSPAPFLFLFFKEKVPCSFVWHQTPHEAVQITLNLRSSCLHLPDSMFTGAIISYNAKTSYYCMLTCVCVDVIVHVQRSVVKFFRVWTLPPLIGFWGSVGENGNLLSHLAGPAF